MAGEIRQATILVRDRQVTGGALPGNTLMAEPFVNLYDGVLKFSGVTGGGYEPSSVSTIFEVGSTLYNSKITNRLNVNDNFIISGDTGIVSTYGGVAGAGFVGKFLSGTTTGLVLADIDDISGAAAGSAGDVQFNDGSNLHAADDAFNYNDTTNVLRVPNFSADTISAGTQFYSAGTSLETIIRNISDEGDFTRVQPGTNVSTGGTDNFPVVNVIDSPIFVGLVSATGFTDSSLTSGRVTYAGTGGRLIGEIGFEYDQGANLLKAPAIEIGDVTTTGDTIAIFHGNILILGEAISGFTSELYIEDNLIELNYNPTGDTSPTSLGAGWSIQDGSGSAGTDVVWDIRGAATGVANRSFSTNLNDIRIRETGTVSSPNGVRVICEQDIVDGGSY